MNHFQFHLFKKWLGKKKYRQQIKLINSSLLFDVKFYTTASNTHFKNQKEAIKHYLNIGVNKGYNPSEYFNTSWYLEQYPDVENSQTNPLLHYLVHGWLENRSPRPASSHLPLLKQIDHWFSEGKCNEALELTNSPTNDSNLYYELLFRKVRILFYQAKYNDCLEYIDKVQVIHRKIYCPEQYNEFCDIVCKSLCAQKKYDLARDYLLKQYQPILIWQPTAMSMLRETIKTNQDLMFYKSLIDSHIEKNNDISTEAYLHWSLALRDMGNYEEAINAIRKYFIQGVTSIHKFGSEKIPEKDTFYWQQAARTALLNLKENLDAAGLPFFLISGTLLGCIREQDILSHDKDIDVGILEDVSIEKVKQVVSTAGRFCIMHAMHDQILQIRHANGVSIDIFVHWQEGNKMFHRGRKTGWWNSAFTLKSIDFLNEKFLIPSNPDQYLTENYGDWQEPKANFETFADTPNMFVTNQSELVWYYYKSLLHHYKVGDKTMYKKIWEKLNQIKSTDEEEQKIFNNSMERAI